MNSLPEQHIDSLKKQAREDAYWIVSVVCVLRGKGLPEDEIATKAGFTSARDMYDRLERWGLPGLLPSAEKQPEKGRKARMVEGTREELPAITNAAPMLRDTIRTLEVYLEQATTLKEALQGGYFIDEGETDESNVRELRGAQWHPHPYVVVLIAVSILEHHGDWGFIQRLIRELHPRPSEANRQQLVRFIYGKKVDANGHPILDKATERPVDYGDGLLDRAKQVATLIRGKPKIQRGVKRPAIPSYDQFTARYMRSLADKGFSQEQVLQTFREDWERWKVEQLQSLREELAAKVTSDQATVDEIEQEIRLTEGEEFDEGDFYRIWGLSRYLK